MVVSGVQNAIVVVALPRLNKFPRRPLRGPAELSFLTPMIEPMSGNAMDANNFDALICKMDAYRGAGMTVDAGTLNKTHYT